ncbi:12078_t:CDS:2 [Ambispora leptoticha]|uniref:12078_t:CDS:1 n=1 Tax=Ambispora leptoticha TaxID=144679 RepID=A0A9N9FUG3_9GLOM|nr:12078_t:CDS:2 [Ambispora leptoticha]
MTRKSTYLNAFAYATLLTFAFTLAAPVKNDQIETTTFTVATSASQTSSLTPSVLSSTTSSFPTNTTSPSSGSSTHNAGNNGNNNGDGGGQFNGNFNGNSVGQGIIIARPGHDSNDIGTSGSNNGNGGGFFNGNINGNILQFTTFIIKDRKFDITKFDLKQCHPGKNGVNNGMGGGEFNGNFNGNIFDFVTIVDADGDSKKDVDTKKEIANDNTQNEKEFSDGIAQGNGTNGHLNGQQISLSNFVDLNEEKVSSRLLPSTTANRFHPTPTNTEQVSSNTIIITTHNTYESGNNNNHMFTNQEERLLQTILHVMDEEELTANCSNEDIAPPPSYSESMGLINSPPKYDEFTRTERKPNYISKMQFNYAQAEA